MPSDRKEDKEVTQNPSMTETGPCAREAPLAAPGCEASFLSPERVSVTIPSPFCQEASPQVKCPFWASVICVTAPGRANEKRRIMTDSTTATDEMLTAEPRTLMTGLAGLR